jgi:diguanylate cyclase (GGDEF)-like protein
MIALLDADGELLDGNKAFKTHKQRFPDAHTLYDLLPASEHHVLRKWVAETQRTDQPIHEAVSLLTADQRETCFDCLLIPLPAQKLIFIAEEISSDPDLATVVQRLSRQVKLFKVESAHAKQIAINKQIEVEAILTQADEIQHIDPLTFLPNRRLIMKALQSEVSRARRYHTPFSISMLDVDHFKAINDTYGHQVGDEVLEQIAHHLRDHIRHPDSAGRYGGEEFLILLPNTPIEPASEQAARLCNQMRALNITAGEKVLHLTVSMGIAELQPGTETWQELLSRADKALYQAKEQGRDRWVAVEN